MQRLNIPLSRHTKTTRPLRQVVWFLVIFLLVGGFVIYRVEAMFFTRNTILSMTPSDTILAVEMNLNKKTAPFLLDWLSGVPLLSERSLELNDVAHLIHGNFAVFIQRDGHRSLAIRCKPENLPTSWLDALFIEYQQQGPFTLLSSTLVPIKGITASSGPLLPSIGTVRMGHVVLPQDGLQGDLTLSEVGLGLKFKAQSQNHDGIALPGAAVALSGLRWGMDVPHFPALQRLLTKQSLILENAEDMNLAVVPTDAGTLEILLGVSSVDVTSDEIIDELEQIGAFARPTIVSQTLPDGSELAEILVQPELSSVEEVSTSSGTLYRVSIGGGAYVLAAQHNNEVLFANKQNLLESTLQPVREDRPITCLESRTRVVPTFLMDQVDTNHFQPELAFYNDLFSKFSSISLEFKKYSTEIHFCIS